MKKSLFARYFTVCISVIIISITVLGGIMLIFASQYFRAEQYTLLKKNLQRAVNLTQQEYLTVTTGEDGSDQIVLDAPGALTVYQMFSSVIDADFFLSDTNGKVLMCTEDISCRHLRSNYTVPIEFRKRIERYGAFSETGNFKGLYAQNYFTVGVPLVQNDVTVGYLFASSPSENLQVFLKEILNMLLISSGLVLLLAFVIIFVVTSQLVRPLKDMAYAAKQYGKGDFSPRVPIQRDDELGQLAQALNNMAVDLSVIESSHRSFTANVSHELKTPMTTIGGFIDGMLDGTIPEKDHKKYLQIVSSEIARLSRLVRSMLDLSKIEAGEMPVNLTTFNAINTLSLIHI